MIAIIIFIVLSIISKLPMFEGVKKITYTLKMTIIIAGIGVILVKTGLLRIIATIVGTFFISLSNLIESFL